MTSIALRQTKIKLKSLLISTCIVATSVTVSHAAVNEVKNLSILQNSIDYAGYYHEAYGFYLKARDLLEKYHVFTEKDYYKVMGMMNMYGYVDGNPVNNIDKSGHVSLKLDFLGSWTSRDAAWSIATLGVYGISKFIFHLIQSVRMVFNFIMIDHFDVLRQEFQIVQTNTYGEEHFVTSPRNALLKLFKQHKREELYPPGVIILSDHTEVIRNDSVIQNQEGFQHRVITEKQLNDNFIPISKEDVLKYNKENINPITQENYSEEIKNGKNEYYVYKSSPIEYEYPLIKNDILNIKFGGGEMRHPASRQVWNIK